LVANNKKTKSCTSSRPPSPPPTAPSPFPPPHVAASRAQTPKVISN
jgi:hypothetical protein